MPRLHLTLIAFMAVFVLLPLPAAADEEVPRDESTAVWEVISRLPDGEAKRQALTDFLERYGDSGHAGAARSMLLAPLPGAGPQPGPATAPPAAVAEPSADPAATAEAALGLDRRSRALVQRGLAALGHDPGPADGLLGPRTRAAIRAYQRAAGATPTGYLDEPAARKLIARGGEVQAATPATRGHQPDDVFRDCADCPEMVVVPAGSFTMGSPAGEEGRRDNEGPQRRVMITGPLAVGRFQVTLGEFGRFVAATGRDMSGGCRIWTGSAWTNQSSRSWRDPGFAQSDTHPVVCVNWHDAKAYAGWLSRQTGEEYRLLSEAEWEYAARAGATTPFHFGATISTDQANYDGRYTYGSGRIGVYRQRTVTVGSFPANGFGLHDVHGNAWEWVEDCWNDSYAWASGIGTARTTGDCSRRVLRGGSWGDDPKDLRSAYRVGYEPDGRNSGSGFRLTRTVR